MRGLVDSETHDLFQEKLRDRTLRKEPNFRWCAHVSTLKDLGKEGESRRERVGGRE